MFNKQCFRSKETVARRLAGVLEVGVGTFQNFCSGYFSGYCSKQLRIFALDFGSFF